MKFLIPILAMCLYISINGQTIRQIKPSDTDSQINLFDADSHYVYISPNVPQLNLLVIHLPGTGGKPKNAELFGQKAALMGYHSIGLMYPNSPAVGNYCTNISDSSCYENIRREVIEGVDYSSQINLPQEESIFNRAKKLILYLDNLYPNENWGQFLVNNELNFSKIIFSGHSQGGGHACVIGKYYTVNRILCFSSPKDYSNYYNQPAPWYNNNPWATSKNNIYTFSHTSDNYTKQIEIFDSLGLYSFSNIVDIDNTNAPYNNSKLLVTSYPVSSGNEHGCTLTDTKTPVVNNIPIFDPVWEYMLNQPTNSVEALDQTLIKVSPNPVQHSFTLSKAGILTIYNSYGEKVLKSTTTNSSTTINVAYLPNGLYFCELNNKEGKIITKFIKQ